MAPGCKPGGLTPYVGSNPTPCIIWSWGGEVSSVWAGVAQLVAHQPSKLVVAGSSPVARSSVFNGPPGKWPGKWPCKFVWTPLEGANEPT